MNPVLLMIKRKTKVPTKRQIRNLYRSDWKLIDQWQYADTTKLFATIGGGPIKTDSQLAKFMLDRFGPGFYHILAIRKGRKGFWSFWSVELTHDTWRRLPKIDYKRERELREYKQEVSRVKKQMDVEPSPQEKKSLNDEMEFLKEIYSVEEEDEGTKKRRGPSPYIKQTLPLYKNHAYESYMADMGHAEEVRDYW